MDTEHHTNTVEGLRQLADFLDLNPALADALSTPTMYLFADNEAEFRANNALLGTFDKGSDTYCLKATKTFGPIDVQSRIDHKDICEKRVIGTRTVAKQVPADPDYVAPEYTTIEVEEDITEWVCPPSWVQR